jgi:SecD/SecF fusion protein
LLLLDAFKIDLPMVAAFLTLVGYSVNDTIVVFDRIRESRKKHEPMSWSLLNNSINQTLSRTLLTGLTTWLVAVILYGVGGQAIHGFAFVLVAGVVVGTYSSVYIASPVLMWLGQTGSMNQENNPISPTAEPQGDQALATHAAAVRKPQAGNSQSKKQNKGRRKRSGH